MPDTRFMYVADREADIIALMARARDLGTPADWLIRACHNRALPSGEKLWPSVQADEALGELRFTLAARPGQAARVVCQQVRAKRVQLNDGMGGQVEATCLVASEENPPEGAKPVVWRLLTNRAVSTLEDAAGLIDCYRSRWEIEIFFHVLKNGCKVEALQLGSMAKLERALALFMVVAWRIARLMRLGRECPDLDAGLLFSRDEWQAAYILNRKKVPACMPKLNTVLRLVAALGGFLGRKHDGEPGVKTIWLGLQRVMDFAAGIEFAREAGNGVGCV
jgi:hypothetical protein